MTFYQKEKAAPVKRPAKLRLKKIVNKSSSFFIGFDFKDFLKQYWKKIVAVLFVIFLFLSGVGIYRAYALAATDGLTLAVARIWHLPVGKVNNHYLAYSDYVYETRFYLARTADAKTNNKYYEQVTDKVLRSLVEDALIKDLAKEQGISCSRKEMNLDSQKIIAQYGGKNNFQRDVLSASGVGFGKYQELFINRLTLKNKLSNKVSNDASTRSNTESLATSLLQKIKSGQDFSALAKEYSQDDKRDKGGDLGWFGYGIMVPQVENALDTMNPGEVYPYPVQSMFGYHIIKLEEKSSHPETDTAGVWHARQILLRFPSLNQTLDDKIRNSEIKIYPRIHNPFSEKE